jgi:hypothetical protein
MPKTFFITTQIVIEQKNGLVGLNGKPKTENSVVYQNLLVEDERYDLDTVEGLNRLSEALPGHTILFFKQVTRLEEAVNEG